MTNRDWLAFNRAINLIFNIFHFGTYVDINFADENFVRKITIFDNQ